MMENKRMLTTFDNPYNPFVDFTSWYMYDCEMQYNTCGRLARLADINSEMTEREIDEAKEEAMNFMIKYDLEGTLFAGTNEQIENWLQFKQKQNATVVNA